MKKNKKEISELNDVLDNIIQNSNKNSNMKSKETKVESTFDIINRKIPFTISSLDNLINDPNYNLYKNDNNSINN